MSNGNENATTTSARNGNAIVLQILEIEMENWKCYKGCKSAANGYRNAIAYKCCKIDSYRLTCKCNGHDRLSKSKTLNITSFYIIMVNGSVQGLICQIYGN
ncbi:hypothetical protein Dimus_039261 [Dionaea muscipula]